MRKDLPFFDADKMTLRESYWAVVFHLFDLLLPEYQFRPKRSEVEAWFREEGLEMLFAEHCFYLGRSAPGARKRETVEAKGVIQDNYGRTHIRPSESRDNSSPSLER